MKKNLLFCISIGFCAYAQSNTAVTSGSIGKCAVWDYPYTLYNNGGASQTVNNGVTVTVDQNRNIGALNFSGTGAMNMSGANGITLSGSGGQISCRWDIGSYGSNTILNNNGVFTNNSQGGISIGKDLGIFFTAPYTGSYRWIMGSGWAANMHGAILNSIIGLRKQGDDFLTSILFYQLQPGSCGLSSSGGQAPPTFYGNLGPIALDAGRGLSYAASTAFRTDSGCNNTQLFFTAGTATVLYEN